MTTTFADAVRKARKISGLSSTDIGGLIDKSPSYVRRCEMVSSNRLVPNSRDAVAELAVALELDVDDLWFAAMQDRISSRDPDIYTTLVEMGVFE